jgi:hypothetical protein
MSWILPTGCFTASLSVTKLKGSTVRGLLASTVDARIRADPQAGGLKAG